MACKFGIERSSAMSCSVDDTLLPETVNPRDSTSTLVATGAGFGWHEAVAIANTASRPTRSAFMPSNVLVSGALQRVRCS